MILCRYNTGLFHGSRILLRIVVMEVIACKHRSVECMEGSNQGPMLLEPQKRRYGIVRGD